MTSLKDSIFLNLKNKMIQEFKTNTSTGIFVKVPKEYKNFVLQYYGYAGLYLMETDSKGLNAWKIKLPKAKFKILGFVDNITEDEKKSICDLTTDLGFQQLYESYDQESNEVSLNVSWEGLLNSYNLHNVENLKEPDHLDYKSKNQYGELVWTSESSKMHYSANYDLWFSLKDRIGEWLVLLEC